MKRGKNRKINKFKNLSSVYKSRSYVAFLDKISIAFVDAEVRIPLFQTCWWLMIPFITLGRRAFLRNLFVKEKTIPNKKLNKIILKFTKFWKSLIFIILFYILFSVFFWRFLCFLYCFINYRLMLFLIIQSLLVLSLFCLRWVASASFQYLIGMLLSISVFVVPFLLESTLARIFPAILLKCFRLRYPWISLPPFTSPFLTDCQPTIF